MVPIIKVAWKLFKLLRRCKEQFLCFQTREAGQRLNIILVAEGAIDIKGNPITAEDVKRASIFSDIFTKEFWLKLLTSYWKHHHAWFYYQLKMVSVYVRCIIPFYSMPTITWSVIEFFFVNLNCFHICVVRGGARLKLQVCTGEGMGGGVLSHYIKRSGVLLQRKIKKRT